MRRKAILQIINIITDSAQICSTTAKSRLAMMWAAEHLVPGLSGQHQLGLSKEKLSL